MGDPRLSCLALCAGIGGLELGLRPWVRTVGYVERDAYAAACLVARMEEQALDPAPVWDDLATFDGRPWRGCVDLISAGFPCQPVSCAGKRQGQADERWLWDDVARIVRDVRPALVFLENTPGLLSLGFGRVLGDLAHLGFDADWGVFSVAGSGAPHLRKRVFRKVYYYKQGICSYQVWWQESQGRSDYQRWGIEQLNLYIFIFHHAGHDGVRGKRIIRHGRSSIGQDVH